MNNSNIIIGVIIGLVLGGAGGFSYGKSSSGADYEKETREMMKMMSDDGARMEKMGTLMMESGMMMQERGAKYNDEEMTMKGKDMEANGKKHKEDGMSMMDEKSMMGMTEGKKMMDMPGMEM
jgi:hypothetical protein